MFKGGNLIEWGGWILLVLVIGVYADGFNAIASGIGNVYIGAIKAIQGR